MPSMQSVTCLSILCMSALWVTVGVAVEAGDRWIMGARVDRCVSRYFVVAQLVYWIAPDSVLCSLSTCCIGSSGIVNKNFEFIFRRFSHEVN